jgi:hypothetical protein
VVFEKITIFHICIFGLNDPKIVQLKGFSPEPHLLKGVEGLSQQAIKKFTEGSTNYSNGFGRHELTTPPN